MYQLIYWRPKIKITSNPAPQRSPPGMKLHIHDCNPLGQNSKEGFAEAETFMLGHGQVKAMVPTWNYYETKINSELIPKIQSKCCHTVFCPDRFTGRKPSTSSPRRSSVGLVLTALYSGSGSFWLCPHWRCQLWCQEGDSPQVGTRSIWLGSPPTVAHTCCNMGLGSRCL